MAENKEAENEVVQENEIEKVEKVEEKVVEQLEDVEFAKEDKKENKKDKKKNIIFLVLGIVALVAIILVIFYVINRQTPKSVTEDFIVSLNAQDFETALNMIDVKGFYALNTTSNGEEVTEETNYEKFYTKFDKRLTEVEDEEEYKDLVTVFTESDKTALKEIFAGMEFKLTKIGEPVLIQGTKGLYKVPVNLDIVYQGQTESDEYTFYINKEKVNIFKTEYKIVGGDVPTTILYMMFLSEYYNNLSEQTIVTE